MSRNAGPHRVKLSYDKFAINADIGRTKKGIEITCVPGRNDPSVLSKVHNRLKETRGKPFELGVSLGGGYTQRSADVGYLRTAFLAAFARLGYRWSITPDKDSIRKQIRSPGDVILENFRTHLRGSAADIPKGLYILREPIHAMLVKIDTTGVFLPWLSGHTPEEISEWIVGEKQRKKSAKYTFVESWSWPRGMELYFDKIPPHEP